MITLKGVGTAVIDGGGADATVAIESSSRVSLVDVEVRNGFHGIAARHGSHINLSGVGVHSNSSSGIRLLNSSSAVLSNVSSQGNLLGLVVDNGSSIIVAGSMFSANTAADVVLTFASRADIRTTTIGTATCDATVLVRGTSGLVCPQ